MENKKVDFFIAGGPKCGTTALAKYLDENPQICFARPKEAWFFSTDIYPSWQVAKNEDDYHSLFFSHYNPEQHIRLGEGTPLYLFSEKAIAYILAYNPQAKFIVMLRNPIEMAYSYHSQLVFNGLNHEDVSSFPKAWRLQETRALGRMLPKNVIEQRVLQYKQVCCLGHQLQRLKSFVCSENIHLVVFDDFKKDEKREYLRVLDFLGVCRDSKDSFPAVNQHKEWRSEKAKKFYFILSKALKTSRLNLNLGILSFIKKKLISSRGRVELPDVFRTELCKEFKKDVALLSEVTGRDFSHWLQ